MELIFQKLKFPKSPGGNLYEWFDAETEFTIAKSGLFVLKIAAVAKGAKQNKSHDDDDLRVSLDGFSFGKYEKNSWKGFNSSSSWNGSTLKSGTKTNYFFVELEQGTHKVQFFADETPEIKSLEVFQIEDNNFSLNNLIPSNKIDSNKNGIPWLCFVFVGTQPKSVLLDVNSKSAKEKKDTDDDNLKVVINGDILHNQLEPSSKKYGDFYFSGDLKSSDLLLITNEQLSSSLAFENAVELWYDQNPMIASLQIVFFDTETFLKEYKDLIDLRNYALKCAQAAIIYFKNSGRPYSAEFLEHSLDEYPTSLVFKENHPFVKKIKADPVYEKIISGLKERAKKNILEGELWPEDLGGTINFDSQDLATAIHGIKKIDYKIAQKKNGKFDVKFTLYDVYDFAKQDVPFFLFHPYEYAKITVLDAINMGENLQIIHDFEIQINIIDKLSL